MINKTILIFLLSLQFSQFLGQNKNSRWKNEDYTIHNYKSFQKLEIIHQEINKNNIDNNLSVIHNLFTFGRNNVINSLNDYFVKWKN